VKRLRGVLQRLPSLFDCGAFDAACNEIRRVVPVDLLGLVRVADDGSHARIYQGWTSPDVRVPAIEWGQRLDLTRERLQAGYPRGRHRINRNTLTAIHPAERLVGDAGILCTLTVPIGDPLQGLVGFGFTSADKLRDEHLPLLRRMSAMLLDRLDWSLLAAHAARLRTMTATMPMGAIMLSGHGTVEEVNPAAERLLGRAASELLGRSIRDLVCAPDGGLLGWRIDEANGPAPALVRTPTAMRPVQAQLAAVRPDRTPPNLYGPLFLVDTHLALIDDLPVIVFTNDATGRCTYVSRAIERVLGYTTDEIYAMRNFAVLNIDAVPADYGRVPGVYERDFRQRHKDGREVTMRYNVRVLADEHGRIAGAEGFGFDITKERDAQRQLLLTDRLAALGMLVAGIGHEINNPAAYVSLGVQQTARHLRGARSAEPAQLRATVERVLPILDDVAAGVHRIAEIVGELKLFTRNPGDDGSPGPIDLNDVVRSAAALVQAELRSRARLSLALQELPAAPGTWTRLSQVVLNLLINAAQAIPPGAPEENEVAVRTARVGDEVHVVVRDSGCCIAAGALPRIFDPFYSTKPVGEGTGLGLAISYDIVRRLGGRFSVESDVGRGSTFTVALPATTVGARGRTPTPLPLAASGSVLVVDDEEALGSAIARELGDRMQVELVRSGGAALAALGRCRYDAVLCDLRMPDLSGAEVYRQTQARDRGQAERFVFITGAAAAANEAEFLRAAGRPVLEKPFAMTELWRTVGRVVGARPS
jgi:PAS domain S-box-containing protein